MSLLDDISNRGAEIRAQLVKLVLPHDYPGDVKSPMLLAYVDIALEHHTAIWLLRASELTGSAFALVRLVFDTMLRALWINAVATERQIEQASRDELNFPPMSQMRDDIKQSYFGESEKPEDVELVDTFFQAIKEAWRIMCSYK
jgi:hypothetical protein